MYIYIYIYTYIHGNTYMKPKGGLRCMSLRSFSFSYLSSAKVPMANLKLAEALQVVRDAGLLATDRKAAVRRAMEISLGDGRETASSDLIREKEDMMSGAARKLGKQVGISAVRQELVARGRKDLANKACKLNLLRVHLAHPGALAAEIKATLALPALYGKPGPPLEDCASEMASGSSDEVEEKPVPAKKRVTTGPKLSALLRTGMTHRPKMPSWHWPKELQTSRTNDCSSNLIRLMSGSVAS